MTQLITELAIRFDVGVEITDQDQRELHDIASRICKRYEDANPERSMWPAGVGHQPTNIWTCGDDEPLQFEEHCFSISCSERENYDWPCGICAKKQGDHGHCITNAPAGTCDYTPAGPPA